MPLSVGPRRASLGRGPETACVCAALPWKTQKHHDGSEAGTVSSRGSRARRSPGRGVCTACGQTHWGALRPGTRRQHLTGGVVSSQKLQEAKVFLDTLQASIMGCLKEDGRAGQNEGKQGTSLPAHGLFVFSFSRSVVSDSLRPHESQHARPPHPPPTPGVHSDSRPSSP